MPEKKKREKVVAEITLTHLTELAEELGCGMNHEEAIAFLNQKGRAYDMWKQMMQAGEAYIKSALDQQQRGRLPAVTRRAPQRNRIAV
jgi:hypothetical protein